MTRHDNSTPARKTAAFKIGEMLHTHGPMTMQAVFSRISYGAHSWNRRELIQKWIDNGWFERQDDKIALTEFAFAYLEGAPQPAPEVPGFVGIPATGCTFNMLTRPAYKTPRTYRREGPAWAQRPAGFGFKSATGAKEVAL